GSYGPDQLHEPGHDAKDQNQKIKPGSMQPAVKASADQPSREGGRGKDESQLAVSCQLYQDAFLSCAVLTRRWHGFGLRSPMSRRSDRVLKKPLRVGSDASVQRIRDAIGDVFTMPSDQ